MKIGVRSPARLHLGLIDPTGRSGRKYGSIGVAIREPSVEISAEKSPKIDVRRSRGVETTGAEVRKIAKRVIDIFGIDGGVKVEVERDIPKHVGLGSTTQMALSVGTAVSKIYGIEIPPRDLAKLFGLGKVSNIGTAAFESGGFIVDCGLREGRSVPPTSVRLHFPEDWYFVVVTPDEKRGLDEMEEERVLGGISVPADRVGEICQLLLMKMIPAVIERDIESFGKAMTRIQVLVGKSFARYQRGLYYGKVGELLIKFLLEKGAHGSGQSSWGPTVYGVVDGEEACKGLGDEVRSFMAERGIGGTVRCVPVSNEGASIRGF